MDSPKDRANDPKRKAENNSESKPSVTVSYEPVSFADDPKSRNTGWFFSGK